MPSRIPFFSSIGTPPALYSRALPLLAALAILSGCPLTEAPETGSEAVTLVASTGGNGGGPRVREKGGGPKRVTFMTWNTQCFFDAEETGAEFKEFRGAKSEWSPERYETRLDRLREVLLMAGTALGAGPERAPDIAILEEIESARVIEDLCNRLPSRARYPFAAFVPPPAGSAFATAILSRYPIRSVTAHAISREGVIPADTSLRPLVEVTVDADGLPITVFGAHWKSKSDASDTNAVRDAQERILAARIGILTSRDPGSFYVAAGDFNQVPGDFDLLAAVSVSAWTDWLARCAMGDANGPEGSYWFDGRWEAIDHVFHSRESETAYRASSFRPLSSPPLTDAEGHPERYEVFSGKGYSDHLPLIIAFDKMN
jgi:endonuclease/exonuclease/phosphatase family metal-dependent hydrolase